MNKDEILAKLTGIFHDELDNDAIVLSFETTAEDIEEWDSLSHIQLIVAVEKAFKVRFTSSEIQSWNNVGEMIDCILSK
ncbi:acyl carrier protein [Chryseobacterium carnipullorum]|uniref:Acyl carrier protein n=1 Tax=Chryseobacterium carnipullorum TaxID=1124835 RepID=A0A1M7CCB7_CHRCU|nr:acyl carrier protein [Chryseobacterium carnipullorum]AZA47498.1 acyl carrier protein [Chryseobacterium carnipullorum]AZA66833.1 acyl carrier protein [Chryseobacterium carnipullorum]SHL64830.1 acyl carrier protein [Chryseobacterium carnipullorum]STD10219.1 acyl carrier protein [Chryseobacterium carnipullorum]